VILKALEKDPDQRFSHIVELRDALLRMLGGMEAYPPGNPTGSGFRPQVTQLPMAQAGYASRSQLSQISGASSAHASQGPGAYQSYAPAAKPGTAVPWGIWAAGGGVAVVLGVVAAVWYAGRGDPNLGAGPAIAQPAPQPTSQPTAQPIDPPAVRAQPFEVRFDSLPSGGVFAAGRSAELCRTPCSLDIDPSDGGPPDRRGFVVKRDGYLDGAVTIDLAGSKRAFHVTLEPVATPPTPPATIAPDAKPDTKPDAKPDAKPDVKLDTKPDAKPDTRRPTKRPGKPAKKDDKDGATGHDTRDPKDARPPDLDHLIDPSDGKPPVTKKPPGKPTIDPSDTLDPFRKK
jgi:hypothetical protein